MKKATLLSILLLTLFSCYKLEENDKRYSARKLQKMLEGTWEVVDYQIDGVSYLDTFFSVNPTGNCHTYTFVQWKNSGSNKSDKDLSDGKFWGDCSVPGSGYDFTPFQKTITLGQPYGFIDSIFIFSKVSQYKVKKLENTELILENEINSINRKIFFTKL